MHLFDGVGYIEVEGKRRFKDRELPTYIGSRPDDEIMNAMMYEIAQVVEAAGLTLATTGAADEAAGWGQLKQAIFESAAIDTAALTDGAVTDAKITDFNLSKASGSISIDGTLGSYQANWQQSVAYLYGQDENGRFFEFSPTELQIASNNPAHTDNTFQWDAQKLVLRRDAIATNFGGYGVQYDGTGSWRKKKSTAASGVSWITENTHHYVTTTNIDTGIQTSNSIIRKTFSCFIHWESGGVGRTVPANVTTNAISNSLVIVNMRVYSDTQPPSSFTLDMEVDGNGV